MPKRTISSRTINRWLSTDHPLGRTLLALRLRAQLMAWWPAAGADRELKQAIARIAPAYSMVDLPRLRHLAMLSAEIAERRIAGAVVECGTWRGGGLALIDFVLRRAHDPRSLWGFDSFAGLPPPGSRDDAAVHRAFFSGWCSASPNDVVAAFAALGSPREQLHLVPGWLADTLATADTGPIALLNVDVDWYDSVKTALDVLVPRVTPNGFVNIDDYGRWRGCDAAVHDFVREQRWPATLLQRQGRFGAWFRKPGTL